LESSDEPPLLRWEKDKGTEKDWRYRSQHRKYIDRLSQILEDIDPNEMPESPQYTVPSTEQLMEYPQARDATEKIKYDRQSTWLYSNSFLFGGQTDQDSLDCHSIDVDDGEKEYSEH